MTGRLSGDGERRRVRFQRRYGVPPEELWAALTEPGRLQDWLGEAARFDHAAGGRVDFRLGEDESQRVRGAILAFEAPRLLEYEWHWPGEDESVVRFELAADGAGTRLALDHRALPTAAAAGYGAGWHAYLDRLELLFEGRRLDWEERVGALLPAYREQAAAL